MDILMIHFHLIYILFVFNEMIKHNLYNFIIYLHNLILQFLLNNVNLYIF